MRLVPIHTCLLQSGDDENFASFDISHRRDVDEDDVEPQERYHYLF